MLMRGRRPKPTHLKLVTGNPGKRPINEREPVPARALPTSPPELNDDAKLEWVRVSEELYRIGLLTDIDRGTLAAYCQAYGRWMQAERAISEMAKRDTLTGGLMIKTSNGNAVQNPLIGTANKAMSDMVRYAAEFGMTPSARSRIHGEAPDGERREGFSEFA
jgi:P27 family predicted phage terminase small subunit